MGTAGNGDSRPDREGLPDLPAEWGTVVVPDDASELAEEAAQVRRELRQRRRTARRDVRPGHPAGVEPTTLRIPLVIVSLAVLAALTSLIAVIWQGQQRQSTSPGTTRTPRTSLQLPALDLVGADGRTVPLHSLLPAVLVLVGDCACDAEVLAAAANSPAQVAVVPVTSRVPTPTGTPGPGAAALRPLADPDASLTAFVDGLAPGAPGPTILLVAASGRVVRMLPATTPVEAYREDLVRLPTR